MHLRRETLEKPRVLSSFTSFGGAGWTRTNQGLLASARLITIAPNTGLMAQKPRCRGPLERNDCGGVPPADSPTAHRTPLAESGGRGHTWQPLAASHLGALCGARQDLWPTVSGTSRKARRPRLRFGFYPIIAHRDLYQAGRDPSRCSGALNSPNAI